MLKLALVGYGKMGKAIEQLAASQGHQVVARLTSSEQPINAPMLHQADVAIEFTRPEAALNNVEQLLALSIPVVLGTTGWSHELERLALLVEAHQGALVYGENFSLGMVLFSRLVEQAALLCSSFSQYDLLLWELHHRTKRDAPSGTALRLAEKVIQKSSTKQSMTKPLEGDLVQEQLQVASLRCGSAIGTHTLLIDSPWDRMTLQHEAKSREGPARGALFAAEWICHKRGLYPFEAAIDDYCEEAHS